MGYQYKVYQTNPVQYINEVLINKVGHIKYLVLKESLDTGNIQIDSSQNSSSILFFHPSTITKTKTTTQTTTTITTTIKATTTITAKTATTATTITSTTTTKTTKKLHL